MQKIGIALILLLLLPLAGTASGDKIADAIELVNGRVLSNEGFTSSGEWIAWQFIGTDGQIWDWYKFNTTRGRIYRIVVIDMGEWKP